MDLSVSGLELAALEHDNEHRSSCRGTSCCTLGKLVDHRGHGKHDGGLCSVHGNAVPKPNSQALHKRDNQRLPAMRYKEESLDVSGRGARHIKCIASHCICKEDSCSRHDKSWSKIHTQRLCQMHIRGRWLCTLEKEYELLGCVQTVMAYDPHRELLSVQYPASP